ncbi:hypothetical protein B0H13DRAFT_1060003 [Mycena leptocephala]|nr:hypothetical protein B0H13DRAFT_1060003 [Mycena leptocephala]
MDPGTNYLKTNTVLAIMESKPRGFFKNAVRHLFFEQTLDLSAAEACEFLRMCENLMSFGVTGHLSNPGLLPILVGMQLRRLDVKLTALFAVSPIDRINFDHPIFRSITHLQLYDTIEDGRVVPHLAGLPALTHLGLRHTVPWDVFRDLLSRCERLVLLVYHWDPFSGPTGEKLASRTPFTDARFVVTNIANYRLDWEAGVEGKTDV